MSVIMSLLRLSGTELTLQGSQGAGVRIYKAPCLTGSGGIEDLLKL